MTKKKSAPVGRPTKYKSEFCELLVEHMKKGYSYESFGAVIGTGRSILYLWEKQYPEFLDAKSRALDCNAYTLETIGLEAMTGNVKGFNTAIWFGFMNHIHNWDGKKEIADKTNEDKTITVKYKLEDA